MVLSWADPPLQIAAGLAVAVTGSGFMLTLIGAEVDGQFEVVLVVTVYVPGWLTVIDWVVAPLDQR